MLVVLYHPRDLVNGPQWLDLGNRLFGNGAVGVDLFFLISGFIMVQVTVNAGRSVRDVADFLARRVARIWPVYAVATLVAVALHPRGLFYGITTASQLRAIGKALIFYPQSADGAPFLGYAPHTVGWTLNYEMWFYVLFAIALFAGRWR